MRWFFESPLGTLWITPHHAGGWVVRLGDEVSEIFDTPAQAADTVYTMSTGIFEWDAQEEPPLEPVDLSEWERDR